MEKGTSKGGLSRSFPGTDEGLRGRVGAINSARNILKELRDFCQELFANAARHQVILAGKFGTCISQAIVGVIDQDSIDVDKGIVDVAAALELLNRHGPPVPSQRAPDLASPDIRTTRLAAD